MAPALLFPGWSRSWTRSRRPSRSRGCLELAARARSALSGPWGRQRAGLPNGARPPPAAPGRCRRLSAPAARHGARPRRPGGRGQIRILAQGPDRTRGLRGCLQGAPPRGEGRRLREARRGRPHPHPSSWGPFIPSTHPHNSGDPQPHSFIPPPPPPDPTPLETSLSLHPLISTTPNDPQPHILESPHPLGPPHLLGTSTPTSLGSPKALSCLSHIFQGPLIPTPPGDPTTYTARCLPGLWAAFQGFQGSQSMKNVLALFSEARPGGRGKVY